MMIEHVLKKVREGIQQETRAQAVAESDYLRNRHQVRAERYEILEKMLVSGSNLDQRRAIRIWRETRN